MIEWFIVVVMAVSNPTTNGQSIFLFNQAFESREECMVELQTNSMVYFNKAFIEFKIPPLMANCIDSQMGEEIKTLDKLSKGSLST